MQELGEKRTDAVILALMINTIDRERVNFHRAVKAVAPCDANCRRTPIPRPNRPVLTRYPIRKMPSRTHGIAGSRVSCCQEISTATFNRWANQKRIQYRKLRIARFDHGLRGMEALETLKAGDVAVQLPRTSALFIEPNTKGPVECPPDVWNKQPWFAKLALRVMLERAKGKDSDYAGYIISLPEKEDIPFFWPEKDLLDLRYPSLIQSIKKQKREWQELADTLAREAPELKLDKGLFLSSLSLVRSRSFSGPYIGSKLPDRIRLGILILLLAAANILFSGTESIAQTVNAVVSVSVFNFLYDVFLSQRLKVYLLAPGVDFMNHDCNVQSDLKYDYFSDGYSVRLDRDYDVGDQVFISYGSRSNDDLLQYYGFIEENNPHDTVRVEMGMVKLYQLFEEIHGEPSVPIDVVPADIDVYREGFDSSVVETLRSWIPNTSRRDDIISHILAEFIQREITNLKLPVANAATDREHLIMRFRSEKISILKNAFGK